MKAKLREVRPGILSVDLQGGGKSPRLLRSKEWKWPLTGRKVTTRVIKPGLLEVHLDLEDSERLRTLKVADSHHKKQDTR
jgi:hypothetical protein